jgi:hypothetical protein
VAERKLLKYWTGLILIFTLSGPDSARIENQVAGVRLCFGYCCWNLGVQGHIINYPSTQSYSFQINVNK